MNVLAAIICCLAISTTALGQSADLILINGNVRTLDLKNPIAEAVAVSNGRIIAVGKNSAIRALANAETRVIDAKGQLVLPGFNDAHVHLTGIGNLFSHLDLRSARSFEEVTGKVKEFVSFLPRGRWIIGAGLSLDKTAVDLKALDRVSAHNPVLLYFRDPSSAFVNTAALRAARLSLDANSTAASGNRDPSRHATGVVSGTAVSVVRNAVPRDHSSNLAEIVETASNYAASLGVTSVQDVHSDDLAVTLRHLSSAGRLKTRVYDCIGIKDRQKLINAGIKAASGDAMVRNGCVKGNAQFDEVGPEDIKQSITDADKAGLQVMIHAIGEKANENALDAFEFAAARNGKRDRRFRIEHAHRINSANVERSSRSAVTQSMQPHLFDYGRGLEGDDYRLILDRKVRIAFGSDASITDFNPLLGIHAAVNTSARQALTVDEAVRAYTIGSAYAEFQEKEKGSIEKGKLADLVILSDDIFIIDPVRIESVKVVSTIVNGKLVYEANE